MPIAALTLDEGLRGRSRLAANVTPARQVRAAEVLVLLAAGAAAALLTTFAKANLRIPGHHILYVIFPMVLGLAAVPRRGAGSLMGAAALGTVGLLGLTGVPLQGPGALTSLVLTGPLLDAAVRGGRRGWRLYLGLVLAGCLSSTAAFVVRGAVKLLPLSALAAGDAFSLWWSRALLPYALSGIGAGLISAATWFRWGGPPEGDAPMTHPREGEADSR